MTAKQRFLFLQGVCSPFFPTLAKALRESGHHVQKINFSVGDTIYWRQGESIAFRGSMETLPDFYHKQYEQYGITDIVLFGDCRPVHRPAIQVAKLHGIRIHVFEEGYFRPYWITLERDGVNGNSSLPRDPVWYREQAKKSPHFDNGSPFRSPFWKRAAYDVGYNFWAGANPLLHRGVRSHIPYTPLKEYLGYVKRGVRVKLQAIPSRKIEAKLIAETAYAPFFLMPLQLAIDAQIVHHSPFKDMSEALHLALVSFSQHAPKHTRFVVKIHPLDPGLVNYKGHLFRWARQLRIAERVFYLESGNLPSLLSHTAGVVTVNSTVGASALLHARPTIALGNALYDMPDLTYQHGLDKFWTDRKKPDIHLFKSFRDVVISNTQVNGGFYSEGGIRLAVQNSLPKLIHPATTLLVASASPSHMHWPEAYRHPEPSTNNNGDIAPLILKNREN